MTVAGVKSTEEAYQGKLIRAGLAEAIGVFIFVFSGCCCAASDGSEIFAIACAFGLAIMVMAFTWGGQSGGHLNPAVSLGFLLTQGMTVTEFGVYTLSQLVGGFLGAIVSRLVLNADVSKKFAVLVCTAPGSGVSDLQALGIEVFTTFSLVFTVFCVAVDNGNDGSLKGRQPFAAIPIGFAVVMGILASGHLSGGSMNPARSFGPAVAGAIGEHTGDGLSIIWIYFLGPFVGASLAAVSWRYAFVTRYAIDEMAYRAE